MPDVTGLHVLACIDSVEAAEARRKDLGISREVAVALGRSAVAAIEVGYYVNGAGEKVDWRAAVDRARAQKVSIRPDDPLPVTKAPPVAQTRVQVANETTLQAARRLVEAGGRPLALNFADGVGPGGGFVAGGRAQEEVLCRSSALFSTLDGDPMYEFHARGPKADASDWAIYSPDVPVFRTDDGAPLNEPWALCVLTSAAPYAHSIGQPRSGDLLRARIHRTLAIAAAFGHRALVLGAWGCGAFGNDPRRTAEDYRRALEHDFAGAFSDVVFAVADWSPERKFLGPFRDAFS